MDYLSQVNSLFVYYILSNYKFRKAQILKVPSFLHAPYCPEWTTMKLWMDQYKAIRGIGFNLQYHQWNLLLNRDHLLCNAML